MSRLAIEHEAVNLGQGFPDDPGPLDVREKAAEAAIHGWNQYPPMMGTPDLRRAVAHHYKRFQGVEYDPMSEVMVTSGATEALAGALMALIEPATRWCCSSRCTIATFRWCLRAGGVPKLVTLKPPSSASRPRT